MLQAFDFKFSWLPEGAIDSVVKKIDVLVREDVTSMLTFQMIVLDLAADCVNPGRMMMVHFFSESVKEDMRDIEERVRKSELVTMVLEPIYGAGKELSEIDKGNRARKDDMSDAFPSTTADQRKSEHPKRNNVIFNPEVTVHLIPNEDHKSEWMQCAIDRCHFQRRIQLFEELFTAL